LETETKLEDGKEEAYTWAAYAQDEIRVLENLSVVAGVRMVKHKEFGSEITPKLSALFKLNDFNFRATYAKGFKAPTLKELYYRYERGSSLYLGNTDLDPQKSNYYSLAAEYNVSKFSVSVTAYQNKVDDMIDYKTIETTPEDKAAGFKKTKKHFNIGEANTMGIDFLFNYRIGGGFTVGGGYSFVDANNETEDIRLERIARNYANFRLLYDRSWKDYSLNVSLIGRVQDEKFYEGEPNADGYNLWKLTSSHRFANVGSFQLEATLGVDNIFDYVDDKPYGSNYGTLNPGRTVFVGFNIKFAK
jgi:outer membrane receptor for ferrienterochelin and colicins